MPPSAPESTPAPKPTTRARCSARAPAARRQSSRVWRSPTSSRRAAAGAPCQAAALRVSRAVCRGERLELASWSGVGVAERSLRRDDIAEPLLQLLELGESPFDRSRPHELLADAHV